MIKTNIKTYIKSIISIVLSICFIFSIFSISIQANINNEEIDDQTIYEYVENIKIYENVSLNEARSLAKKDGYKLLEKDLNVGNKGVYLAYKSTNDESLGITEIAMLEMNVDYQMSNFQAVINSKIRELLPKAQMLERASQEFAQKYILGSYDAQYAYNMLDLLYIDELNMTLAQAIIHNKANADLFNKILVRSTSGFSAAITHALTIGISDFENDNWAMRVNNAQTKYIDAGKGTKTEYDLEYSQLADDVVRTVQSFATNYRKAEAREFANEGIALNDEEFVNCENVGEAVEIICNRKNVQENDGDVIYLLSYAILNQYDYDENTKLGDYIIWAGEQSYESMESLRYIYPIIEAMTNSQAEMLSISDLALFAIYLQNNEEIIKADEAAFTELKNSVKEYNRVAGKYGSTETYVETVSKNQNAISIWAGVNQAIYDQEVAITDDAIRYNTAGSNYAAFTKDTSLQYYLDRIEVYFNIFQYSAGLVTGLAHVVAMFAGYFSLYSAAMAAFALGGAYAVLGVLAMTFFVIEIIAIVALIVWLVVEFIAWIWPEDEKDDVGEYTPIPSKVFDIKDISYDGEVHTSYVMYECAYNQKNKCADLNADKGKRWNALYYTNSKLVGNAIRVSELEEMFIVQYGNYSATAGYSSVVSLGSHNIANINANTNKQAIYLLYRNRSSTNNTPLNEGISEGDDETMYLETIKLYSSNSETAAKALFKKEVNKGYILLDYNMARGGSKTYTYLAYKLTKNKNEALTDIRVCNAYSPDEGAGATLQIGTSTYGLAGNLYNGSSLWITSSKTAGTPIIGAPEFVSNMADAKTGWEPVNLASGGLAYNFYQGKSTDTGEYSVLEKNFKEKIFLYFNPSVKFTSGTEYIGGIAFFEHDTWWDDKEKYLNSYLKDTGYTLINKTNIGCLAHTFYKTAKSPFSADYVANYMAYTTTYNPYRAIYDIGYYEGTATTTSLNAYFTTIENNRSVAYNSVAMYMTGLGDSMGWLDLPGSNSSGYIRTMNTNNAFLSATLGNAGAVCKAPVWTKDPRYSFDCYNMFLKGMYVRGHIGELNNLGEYVPIELESEKPLVLDDLFLSTKKTSMNGYYPLRNMLDRYDRTEINIAAHSDIDKYGFSKSVKKQYYLSGEGKEYSAYLYIRKDYEERPRYISSISVYSFEMPELTGDKDTKKALKQAYMNAAEDTSRFNILAFINAEMIDMNVALKKGDRWTSQKETYHTVLRGIEDDYDIAKKNSSNDKVSYVGVSRTNNASEAIRGIIKYKPSNAQEMANPPSTITIGKAKYICAGSKISGVDGDYYLYYTTNKGVSPCEPITNFFIDEELLVSKSTTALTYTSQDTAQSVAKGFGNTKDTMYYHCEYDNTKPNAISKLYIGVGKNSNEAKADLLNQGCFSYIPLCLNSNAGGKTIYLGYEKYYVENIVRESYKTNAKYEKAYKNEYYDAIKDIIVTIGEPYKESIVQNGITYYPVSNVNLNDGTYYGREIYMYYTRDMALDKSMIVSALGAALFDRTPENTVNYTWEKLLTTQGKKANLNDGCITFSGDNIKENSVFVFIHRYGNVVKAGAEITGGYTSESEQYGKFYYKR